MNYSFIPKQLARAHVRFLKAQQALAQTRTGPALRESIQISPSRQAFLDAVNAHCGTQDVPAVEVPVQAALRASDRSYAVAEVSAWWRQPVKGGYARFNSPEAAA